MDEPLDEPIRTGHDVHFLSRLSRVERDQTDLALRLYRSPHVVRELFDGPAIPPDAGRIAVAIAPGDQPPHVLIARDGAFVTCLGSAMSTGALPVLPWSRLEGVLRRDALRAAEDRRAHQVLDSTDFEALYKNVFGTRLPREQFLELAALTPLLHADYSTTMGGFTLDCITNGAATARIKCPPRPPDDEALRAYWQMFHASGNLVHLLGAGGRRLFDLWAEIQPDKFAPYNVWFQPARYGYLPVALRVFWTLGRAGKLALPAIKHELDRSQHHIHWLPAVLALAAVAARHRAERAEALGLIGAARLPPAVRDDPAFRDLAQHIHESVRKALAALPEDDAQLPALLRDFAGNVLKLDLGGALTDDLAGAVCANVQLHYLDELELLPITIRLVVLTARLPAEQFYFPRDALRFTRRYTPEAAVKLASLLDFRTPPIKAAAKPGRNDPCHCGSGKKYKKCCG